MPRSASDSPSDLTCLIVDGGIFVDLATRLARDFRRTLYHCTIDYPFPKVNEAAIGLGMIETVDDFWPIKDEIDLFIFPDCAHAGLQLELIKQGFPVWGSRNAVDLELKRIKFKDVLKSVGLEVGPYQVCNGMTELRRFLRDKEDRFIKISKYRGSMETLHWIDYESSCDKLDQLAVKLGGVQELIQFLVEESIDTEIEWGLDCYFSGGKFPNIVAHGPECKDKCYAGAVVEWDKLPEELKDVAESIAPVLASYDYCNFWSMEVRVAKDGTPYFTDPTCRMPTPAGAAQMELWENLADIIWQGAHGICVDPVPTASHAVEAIMDHTGDDEAWRKVRIPDEVRQWVKLYCAGRPDVVYEIPPFSHLGDSIGVLLGIGDSTEEAIEEIKEVEDALKGQPVTAYVDVLADALKEVHTAEDQGMQFSGQETPEPEIVLADK